MVGASYLCIVYSNVEKLRESVLLKMGHAYAHIPVKFNFIIVADVALSMFSSVDKAWQRYTNRPGFAWTVQELARSVQCPGQSTFCPGILINKIFSKNCTTRNVGQCPT